MALQYSVALRTSQVAQIQTVVGSAGVLKLFSGNVPANCTSPDPGGLLATMTLPATFLVSANGSATLTGTWSATTSGTGNATSFRLYDGSSVCHMQGTVTIIGGGGDLQLPNVAIAPSQSLTITTFSITAENA